MMTDTQINEHVEQFVGLLASGEYPQLVMENDGSDDDWVFDNESLDEYETQINKPENYAYIVNRFKKNRLEG
jgi:hypothetical protein